MTIAELCSKSSHELLECKDFAHTKLSGLSLLQFNWKPAPDSWSIAEVLEHLIKSNEPYFSLLRDLYANKGGDLNDGGTSQYKPTVLGGFLIKMLQPSQQKKLKAAPSFGPSGSKVDLSIINKYNAGLENLALLSGEGSVYNLNKMRMASPVMGLIRYSAADALNILATHSLRHTAQIQRILENPNFPR